MKIDMVTPFSPTQYGGNVNAALNLTRELSNDEAYDVRFYTFKTNSFKSSTGETEKIPFYDFPSINPPFARETGEFSIGLIKTLSNSKADIIHVHGLARPFNNLLLQKFVGDKPIIFTAHGLDEALRKVTTAPYSRITVELFTQYLSSFTHIIALTWRDKKRLSSLGCQAPVSVIPNGINFDKFKENSGTLQVDEDVPKILCVSRFDTYKGFEDLLKALTIVKQDHDFRCFLVGSVSDKQFFNSIKRFSQKLKLSSVVKFFPSVSDSKLSTLYRTGDIFVFPSRMDTMPLTVLEAMHFGLPIVSTSVGGVPHLLQDGINGFLVSPKKPEEMASKIIALLESWEKRETIGEKNKEKSLDFSWEHVANRVKRLYEKILRDPFRRLV